jgi:AAA15 family ATPase/GTPase
MEASNSKVKTRYPDNYTSTDVDYDLLKTAVIVGENAGGKSNFIGSLKFLKSLVDFNSQVQSVGAYVNAFSFLTEKDPEQRFEICFISEKGHIYKYCLGIDSNGITSEGLYKQSKRKGTFSCLFSVIRDKAGKYEKRKERLLSLELH